MQQYEQERWCSPKVQHKATVTPPRTRLSIAISLYAHSLLLEIVMEAYRILAKCSQDVRSHYAQNIRARSFYVFVDCSFEVVIRMFADYRLTGAVQRIVMFKR
jgi:hypothetical protein